VTQGTRAPGGTAATSIESDTFISSQFTLLGQGGSHVIRGMVQLVPIGNTVLYLRPIWVQGEGSQTFPRYRFIAAAVADRAVLGNDVTDAVTALLTGTKTQFQLSGGISSSNPNQTGGSTSGSTTTTTTPTSVPPSNATASQLLTEAQLEFQAANAALANQDLAGYQRHTKAAQALVAEAQAKLGAGAQAPSTTAPPPAGGSTTSTTATP